VLEGVEEEEEEVEAEEGVEDEDEAEGEGKVLVEGVEVTEEEVVEASKVEAEEASGLTNVDIDFRSGDRLLCIPQIDRLLLLERNARTQ